LPFEKRADSFIMIIGDNDMGNPKNITTKTFEEAAKASGKPRNRPNGIPMKR
jgi:hypothetical protein